MLTRKIAAAVLLLGTVFASPASQAAAIYTDGRVVGHADPAGPNDGWLLFTGQTGTVDDASNFTGLVSSGIPDGTGVTLWDHDLFNTESGNPGQSDSEYIYVYQNVVYWDSDSETNIPTLSNPVNPAGFTRFQETGGYQDVSAAFGLTPGYFQVFSDVGAAPEPATLALFGAGLARSRRHAPPQGTQKRLIRTRTFGLCKRRSSGRRFFSWTR